MKFDIRIRAAGLVVNKNRVLLNAFEKDGKILYYNIPGGGLEKNERIKNAVAREIKEESGLEVKADKLLFALEYEPYSENYFYGETYSLTMVFSCKLISDDVISEPEIPDHNPDDDSIVSSPQWVNADALREINLVPKINNEIVEYMKTGIFIDNFYTTEDVLD